MKRLLALFALLALPAFAEPVLTDIEVGGVDPTSGQVDIAYTVPEGESFGAGAKLFGTVVKRDTGRAIAPATLFCDADDDPLAPGRHTIAWDMLADAPHLSFSSLELRLAAVVSEAPAEEVAAEESAPAEPEQAAVKKVRLPMYLVIDLSGGPEAESYPVSELDDIPEGGWTDEYKMTKLVLRLLSPGTFQMGSPEDEPGRDAKETLHAVTLTDPYYIGVFEMTQKQYELVTGQRPSPHPGDNRPVDSVSYQMIRGSDLGAKWPASADVDPDSFLGKLRAKTGRRRLDLPTEAQWEYACRAGSTGAFCNGAGIDPDATPSIRAIARFAGNRNDDKGRSNHTAVGSYEPNAWGLYDMHGNVWEWCLDNGMDYTAEAITNPGGKSDDFSSRMLRGGGFGTQPASCRSAHREPQSPDWTRDNCGFRLTLVVTPPAM